MSKKQVRNKELNILRETNKKNTPKMSRTVLFSIIGVAAALLIALFIIVNILISTNSIAKINGKNISKEEFNYYLNYAKTTIESSQNLTDDASITAYWSVAENVASAKESALSNLKQVKIASAQAKEMGMEVSEEEIEAIDSEYSEQRAIHGAAVDKNYYIVNYGVKFNTYKKIAIENMYAQAYNSQLYSDAEPSEEDMKAEYKKLKKENLATLASVRHILMTTTNGNGEELTGNEKKEKQREIEKVFNLVQANPDKMIDYVKEYSEDNYEENEGLYELYKDGTTPDGSTLVSEFPEWAFKKSTSVGSVAKVKTTYGTHIVRLEKMEEQTYKKMKNSIQSKLWYTNYSNKLSELAEQANIEMNDSVYNAVTIKY